MVRMVGTIAKFGRTSTDPNATNQCATPKGVCGSVMGPCIVSRVYPGQQMTVNERFQRREVPAMMLVASDYLTGEILLCDGGLNLT
jgi:hypothetical protein